MLMIFALPDGILYTAIIISILVLALIIAMAIRAHREKITTGEEALIGSEATVLDWSGRHGEVHTWGERWAAESDIPLDLKKNDIVFVVGKKKLLLHISNIQPVLKGD